MRSGAAPAAGSEARTERARPARVRSTLLSVASACAATQTRSHLAAGEPPLSRAGRDLGRVGILPELVWRRDQKDVEPRSSSALAAIERVSRRWDCAGSTRMRPAASCTARLGSDVLDQAPSRGLDTVLFVRVEELGPPVALTLSLPILWAGSPTAREIAGDPAGFASR
jgi:hypothetical protein